MLGNTEKKTSEVGLIPYVTAVEISWDRFCHPPGGLGTLGKMYSCNFVNNPHEKGKTWLLRSVR